MPFDLKVPADRDKTVKGIARRARELVERTSGRPSVADVDEDVKIAPRRPGATRAGREARVLDLDEEE